MRRNNNQNNYNNTNKKQQQEPKFVIKNENFPELLPKSSLRVEKSPLLSATTSLKVEKLPLLSVTKAETTTSQINQLLTAMDLTTPLTKPKDERTKVIDAIMQNWDRYRDQFESVYGEGVYDDIYSSPPIYFEEPEQGTDDESQEYDDEEEYEYNE